MGYCKKCNILDRQELTTLVCDDMKHFWKDDYYHKYINALYENNKNNKLPNWVYTGFNNIYLENSPESIRHIVEYHNNNIINANKKNNNDVFDKNGSFNKNYLHFDLQNLFVKAPSYLYDYSIYDKSLEFYKELISIDEEIQYCNNQVNILAKSLKNNIYYDDLKKEIKKYGSIEKYLDANNGEVSYLFWDDGNVESRWVKNMIDSIKENNYVEFVKKYNVDFSKFIPIDYTREEIKKIYSNENVENDGHTGNTAINTFLCAQEYFRDRVRFVNDKLNEGKN